MHIVSIVALSMRVRKTWQPNALDRMKTITTDVTQCPGGYFPVHID